MDVTDVEVLHRVSVYIPELGGKRFAENLKKPTKEEKVLLDNKVKMLGKSFLNQVIKARKISNENLFGN